MELETDKTETPNVNEKKENKENVDEFPGFILQQIKPIDSWSFWQKVHFWGILVVFRLDLSHISFNLIENAFAT